MLVIHGIYRVLPSRVAFRNDYCMVCEAPRRAMQVQTLDWLHVYFIPVIPLGFRKRWLCAECGMCPHQIHLTRRLLEVAALVVFVSFTAFFWCVCLFIVPGIAEDPPVFWIFGVISPLGAIATATHLAMSGPDVSGYEYRLRELPPADDVNCPFCGVPLVDEYFECHCPSCGVRRM
jgi:hypothetical protein